MYPSDSLHPEWDQFYTAGIPVTQIAELVSVRVGTVHRYLEGARAADAGLVVARAAAPKGPSRTWRVRLAELREFVAKYGRFPTKNGEEPGEKSLVSWLAEQRHAFLQRELGWVKAKEMSVLGDWVTTEADVARDRLWREKLALVEVFALENGRLPAHRKTSGEEHTLGLWLVTQHERARAGKLLPWRQEALDERVSGWNERRVAAEDVTSFGHPLVV